MLKKHQGLIALLFALALPNQSLAQCTNNFSIEFFGTGDDQQDRVRVIVDDDGPGPDASRPSDIGNGSFTIEMWVKGLLSENNRRPNTGGSREYSGKNWIDGNIFIDRDIWSNTYRQDYGASFMSGTVVWGVGTNTSDPSPDQISVIEGAQNVLDGQWHHIAMVRDASNGQRTIYVDGAIDFQGVPNWSDDDLSFHDDGAPGANSAFSNYLVFGAEKHDARGDGSDAFTGKMDEIRLWGTARTAAEIAATYNQVIPASTPGLRAYWRFETGSGTAPIDLVSPTAGDTDLVPRPSTNHWSTDAPPLNCGGGGGDSQTPNAPSNLRTSN